MPEYCIKKKICELKKIQSALPNWENIYLRPKHINMKNESTGLPLQ